MATILVPVDFSDATPYVVGEAERLATAFSGEICLLNVVEPAAQMVGGDPGFDMVQMPLKVDTKAQERQLAELEDAISEKGIAVRSAVKTGFAVDEILGQIGEQSASYVVLGSHGHGALYHLFAGGVVTGVLKARACPVVVVPVPGKSERPKSA